MTAAPTVSPSVAISQPARGGPVCDWRASAAGYPVASRLVSRHRILRSRTRTLAAMTHRTRTANGIASQSKPYAMPFAVVPAAQRRPARLPCLG